MTERTSEEYRRGARDMLLLIESHLQVAKDHPAKPELVPGLYHALEVVAAISPPKVVR